MALGKVKGKRRKIFWHGLTTPTFLGLKELELETEAQSSRVEEARRRDENEMEVMVLWHTLFQKFILCPNIQHSLNQKLVFDTF